VESLWAAPYDAQALWINALGAVIVLVVIAWAVTRWLKLSRRIKADA
jgi:hypothetical protein